METTLTWLAVLDIFISLELSKSWHAFKKLLKLTTAVALVYTLLYNLQCICHAERLISDRPSASGWGERKCHSVLWNEARFHKTHFVKMEQKRQCLGMVMPCVIRIYWSEWNQCSISDLPAALSSQPRFWGTLPAAPLPSAALCRGLAELRTNWTVIELLSVARRTWADEVSPVHGQLLKGPFLVPGVTGGFCWMQQVRLE